MRNAYSHTASMWEAQLTGGLSLYTPFGFAPLGIISSLLMLRGGINLVWLDRAEPIPAAAGTFLDRDRYRLCAIRDRDDERDTGRQGDDDGGHRSLENIATQIQKLLEIRVSLE